MAGSGPGDLGAFAALAQYPVAPFFTPGRRFSTGCRPDPQAAKPQYGHEREVIKIDGLAGGDE
jgi:hypothetical protein